MNVIFETEEKTLFAEEIQNFIVPLVGQSVEILNYMLVETDFTVERVSHKFVYNSGFYHQVIIIRVS